MAELMDIVRAIKERSMDAGIIMIEGELAAQSLYASRTAISEALISLDPIGVKLRWAWLHTKSHVYCSRQGR